MQIGSPTGFSAQLQALENAVKGKYQDNQNFDALLQMMNDGASTTTNGPSGGASNAGASSPGSTAGGGQKSGELQVRGLVAVGTKSSNGQVTPYSTKQLEDEQAKMNQVGATSYADALQNFMTLSQANGQAATAAAMSDPSQFTTSLASGTVYESFPL